MGCESNYRFNNPTKQLNNRKFSSLAPLTNDHINPWFITGFSDAESSFFISIYPDQNSKLKWRVTPSFSIHLHIKDIKLLKDIQNFFGVGKVRQNSKTTALFRVDNIQELQIILDHFNKYPLIGDKISDFWLFEKCYKLIKQKQHLTQAGLEQIVSLRYNLNKGITALLKKEFINITPVDRPEYIFNCIPNPFWISGFVSGDSSFSVSIEKSENKIGYRVRLIFGTCLHIKDKNLLIGMQNYFNNLDILTLKTLITPLQSSTAVTQPIVADKESELLVTTLPTTQSEDTLLRSINVVDVKYKHIHDTKSIKRTLLQIKNFADIENKIIPFFNRYPILGIKSLDFADFKKVAELIKNKEHLTAEGLNKITKIVAGMNLSRKY